MTPMRLWMPQGTIAAAVVLAMGSGVPAAPIVARAQTPAPTAAAAPPPRGDVTAGQKIFIKVGCHNCHGNVGQGAAPTGPRIAPNPMAFAAFSRYIRAPRANMPPYTEKVLSDQELADIHAYLRAQPPASRVDGLLPPF